MHNLSQKKDFDIDKAAGHLSDAIKFRTVSYTECDKIDFDQYKEFLLFLDNSYPNIKNTCKKEMINGYSPIYVWKGKNREAKPILLLGHYDVVPADESEDSGWKEKPFSGTIKDGYIWGRGSLDDKNQVISIMEAVEYLIEKGFEPNRDIYFAFGFDEEIGGMRGASKIAEVFEERNIEFECVIDEGGCVIEGIMEGLSAPAAVIGVAEKGMTNIKITVESKGGHSSMPPKNTAVGELAKIITNVEKNPMPARLIMPVREMLKKMAPYTSRNKFIFKNIDKLFPIVKSAMEKSSVTNAMIRTTIAFTMTESGEAPNVLPRKASAVANIRILQGDSADSAIEHIRKVNAGIDFQVEKLLVEEPSQISPIDSQPYKIISGIVNEIFPEAIVVPYLVVGGTDSRKYVKSSKNIYRFSSVMLTKEDNASIHSINEKISVANLSNMIQFYISLLTTF